MWPSESVTYEGGDGTKKWGRIESYGPKFVENIVQTISRDILCYAMKTLSHCMICAQGLILRADGYCTQFYKRIKHPKNKHKDENGINLTKHR